MSRIDADRNLLFGVLALQNGFITREQLIASVSAWVLDKARPLDAILREQEALSAEDHALLEPLVRRHLASHGDDPARSLAAIGSAGSAREALAGINDSDVQASLHDAGPRSGEADPFATRTYDATGGPSSAARFTILRPHAEGGLGKVSVALDRELNRKVAFKEILDKVADHPAIRWRFVAEAEITGKLEHPGIVPVYSLGHDATGRPYYAMRFVEGDNLHAAIERFHNPPSPLDPGERHRRFLGLLRWFLDVCNAVAFAHRKGVLHRDIKPGNILLGEFGETLVVDWGLAKAMGQPGPEAPPDDEPVRLSDEGDEAYRTLGQALGTPGFMSPEQAQGRLDLLGPPSDVYSLGATLYQLLAGRCPFDPDRIAAKLIQRTLAGDFPPPRKVKPDVSPPLEAICLKAMALRPAERYPTPRALVKDIESWLADEPVSVWPEPWSVRTRRWAKRHRTLVTSSAAALVVAVAGLTLGLVLVDAARRRETTLKNNLKSANTQLATALKNVETANATANRRLDQTMEAIRDYYTGISEDVLLGREEFRELREKLLAKPLAFYEAMTSELESAEDERSRALLAEGRLNLGRILAIMGRYEESRRQSRAALAAYEALVAAQPGVPEYQDGLAGSHSNLGVALSDTGDLAGAIEAYRRAVERYEALVAAQPGAPEYQNGLATSWSNLGLLQVEQEQREEAAASFRKAVKHHRIALKAAPGMIQIRQDLKKDYEVLILTLRALKRDQEADETAAELREIEGDAR